MISAVKQSPKISSESPTQKEGASARMAKTKQTKEKAVASQASSRSSKKKGAASSADAFIDKNPVLKTAVAQIEKEFGQGSIMPLGADSTVVVPGIPSGSLSVDLALGGNGFPRGRIIEVFGPESSGKTTLALHAVAAAQANGGVAAFIDAEHALDPSWAKKLGITLETLLVSQPTSGEEAMNITELLIKAHAVDAIVIDSVAALVPQK